MMNVPTYPLFFFEVDKEREEKAAFEALIGESVQWVYFKMVLAAFLVYLVSFLACLFLDMCLDTCFMPGRGIMVR